MHRVVPLLTVLILAAGCAGPATSEQAEPVPLQGLGSDPRAAWSVGDWWDTRYFMDLGPGYREEGAGRIVVASSGDAGYELLAADRGLAAMDYYFDLLHVGRFDTEHRPIVEGEPIVLFPVGLAAGVSWSSWFPIPIFGADRLQPSSGNLTANWYDDEQPDGRLRITGTIDAGFFLDFDYDPATNWFSYVRLTETATGRIALAIDVDAHGQGFTGTLHDVTGTILHERLTITPPCTGPGACDPALANVPPATRVVAGSHGFSETVAYLFSFPVTNAGGGLVELASVDPDGQPARFSHGGLGDRFEGTFYRVPREQDPQGEWTFQTHIVGTAGAYVALFGLDDRIVEI